MSGRWDRRSGRVCGGVLLGALGALACAGCSSTDAAPLGSAPDAGGDASALDATADTEASQRDARGNDSGADASPADAGDPTPLLEIDDTSGWQIFPGGGYRYGPSIIRHPDQSLDMWTCSPGANGAWDYVRYRHSTDDGHTWTPDVVALSPTPGSSDAFSCCDPGAVMIGGRYYVGYTSTQNPNGTANDVYLARATSPSGPFDKWNGASWGGAPVPVVTYTGDPTRYGMGEPSLVLQGGKLYLYFTDDDATGAFTDLSVAADPTKDDWPAHLVAMGHVITHRGAEDSIDVKYVDAKARFIAVSTTDRFGPNSTVLAYQSADGAHFEETPFHGARVQDGAHNMGISGDESGHIDVLAKNFIAYAYAPAGATWGNWPTFIDPIALTSAPLGTTCGGGVSSIVGPNSDWNWSGPKAWDGDDATIFSSDSHGTTADAIEWAYVDLGRALSIHGVVLTPRPGGFGYPVDFHLQAAGDDLAWADIPGQTFTAHATATAAETFAFAPVAARFVRVYATKLGADNNGNHYLQLAEIRVLR